MRITEIFRSIQGESTFAGLPCSFVRLTGCNLRCQWCDTTFAYDGGSEMTIEEIVEKISDYPADLVEVTGGEPLLQQGTPQLCQALLDFGAKVLVETNGTLNINCLPESVIRIMDVKCPSSGETQAIDWNNIQRLRYDDEIKFVVADFDDFKFAIKIISKYSLTEYPILLSPVFNKLKAHILAQWILDSHLPIRMQLQLHKYIWHANKQGV